jgi:2-C-methyl-D-erythritol 4-phosphate cytidylyltransferase/2-C-methyl-D-erythritol 2,4-cyclodiphosphate synthase
MRVCAVVPAAGRGSRFGGSENKIWLPIAGRTVLERALASLEAHPRIEEIVVAGAEFELERLKKTAQNFPKVSAVCTGGDTRAASVRNGMAALPEWCTVVLVHDAARPNPDIPLIDRVLHGVETVGAAVPGLPVADTLKRVDSDEIVLHTVDREPLRAVQTPQGARRDWLADAYNRAGDQAPTDEAGLLEAAGYPVAVVPGAETNLKITRPGDAAVMESWMGTGSRIRTGMGYDVHPFEEGRPLWLGGVQIEHTRGLKGHSDADALVHAVCDALLGAAGLGDIGILFPDTDVRHKDRSSLEFLQEVARLLEASGWSVENIDVALLAEEPRIKPHRAAMSAAMAEALHIPSTRINIKATTCEGMGFVGRREGIACWAVATLYGSTPD